MVVVVVVGGVAIGLRMVRPPRAAESKARKIGDKTNILNEKKKLISCAQKFLYYLSRKEIQ